MKLFNKLLAAALVLGMTACSSDEPTNNGGGSNENQDAFYSSVKFRFRSSARSSEKDGEEIGQDYENKVGSILVVMTTKEEGSNDYKFLTYALNDAPISQTPATNAEATYTITFDNREALLNQAEHVVNLFAFCNPTEELRNKITNLSAGDLFTDAIFEGTDPSITWQKNGFLMSSVEVLEKTLPTETTLRSYNSPANPYKLGTIEVIRTMSRFDFRDASKNGDLSYDITNTETNEVQGTVTLTRVAMTNMADKFYYLPRTKADASSPITLCPTFDGMEDGFVISPDNRSYTQNLPSVIDPLNPGDNDLQWANLADIIGGTEDNDEGWPTNQGEDFNKEGYYIWRYTTENTFGPGAEPATDNTTGYIFEAKITINSDKLKDGDIMYLYGQTLYPNAEAMAAVIEETPVSTLATAFHACFTKEADGTFTPAADDVLKANGFTIYRPNAAGDYLCYYFAFNRHNDNNDLATTGDMEFATVRNNVYKLSVKNITKFGTFEPGTVIEDWNVYFDLDVAVRPWVVRINSLEF